MLIFESLEMILLRTAGDLSHFSMVGNAIVKKTVSGHMKLLQASFHSENHRLASAGGLWKVSLWYFLTSAPIWCCLLCTGLFASASASCQLWCLRVQKLPEKSWAAFTSIKLFRGWQRERIRRCVLFYFFPHSVCLWVVTFSKYACFFFLRANLMSGWLLSSLCSHFWCPETVLLLDKYWKSKVAFTYVFLNTLCSFIWFIDHIYISCVSEFLPEILSTGLKEERLSIVNLILSTLKTRVSALQFTLINLKAFIYLIIK